MNERDQIINFLLQECDKKNRTIQDLQAHQAELHRQLEALTPKAEPVQPKPHKASKVNGEAKAALPEA